MKSRIYEGYVEHVRYQPVWHRLNYPLYFYCFDLDELAALDKTNALFGYNRFRPVALYDSDYLDQRAGSIREKLTAHLRDAGCLEPVSRICMITSARYFSRVFNPVSFYYCFAADESVLCTVAEVNNTYGERHIYVMKNGQGEYPLKFTTDKAFHVSPFNDISGFYEMSFSPLEQEIEIHVDLYRSGEKVFGATLWGRARGLTLKNHAFILLRHPFIPHLTVPRIYLEAAKLHFRGRLAMYDKPAPISAMTIRRIPPTFVQRQGMKVIEDLVSRIEKGSLQIVRTDGVVKTFGEEASPRAACVMVNDNRFYSRLLIGGEVGFGEAFVDGFWDSDDLVKLFMVIIENREAISEGNPSASLAKRIKDHVVHIMRQNTIFGSRKNIAEHYDLSNDFFKTFLDASMSYSCALFLSEEDTLEQAQKNKMQSIIDKAGIEPGDRVLEIGCGWGSFAVEAVKQTGCTLTGITISQQQYDYARQKVHEEGLDDRITILLQDYRHVQGVYDKIVSIEMLEAVGHEYLGTFFACCDRLLAPDGLAVIQVITIPDQRYGAHLRESNWIQKHIFPGGHLPSLAAIVQAMVTHSRLMVEDVENIGIHYAKTLRHWRMRLLDAARKISAMGFDRRFQRKWLYYFSICEAQFALRVISDLQIVFTRESNRRLQADEVDRWERGGGMPVPGKGGRS